MRKVYVRWLESGSLCTVEERALEKKIRRSSKNQETVRQRDDSKE